MIIQYKYVATMFVVKKDVTTFLKDFFDKHFHDFLEGKIGLYVSPVFIAGPLQYMQFSFDLDSKFKGIDQVAKDATMLKNKFPTFDFNIVSTNSGLHMISNVAYYMDMDIVDCNHTLQEIMSKACPSIDWKGSVRVTPFGRLGRIDSTDFYMTPIKAKTISSNIIKKARNTVPKDVMSEDDWITYFKTRIAPKTLRVRLSFILKQLKDKFK